MQSEKILKNVVKTNKESMKHTFNVLVSLEEQIEKMIIPYFDQYEITTEKRKELNDWMHKSKKTRDCYQKLIQEGFDTFELFF